MSSDGKSITISGGSFLGSAIGIGHVEQHGTTFDRGVGLDELRTPLADNADEIVALGRDDEERADLRHEVRKIEKERQAREPDGSAVTSRWKSVLAVLDGVHRAAANRRSAGRKAASRPTTNATFPGEAIDAGKDSLL